MILIAALTLLLADPIPPPLPGPPPREEPIGFTADAVLWKDGPPTLPAGSKIAVLEGNPRSDGMFTMRVRVPAGAALAPHWHPRQERVTILAGAAELGFGATATPGATKHYGAGSFYVNPPRTMHFLFFPEATEMQITGTGPWELFTTNIEAGPARATGSITLRSISPVAGSALSSSSQLKAVVDYAIQNFRPDSFFITFQFESTTPDMTFNAERFVVASSVTPGGPPLRKMLPAASGSATVTADVRNVWDNARLHRPIRVKIYIHESTSDASSRTVAESDWVEYR